MEIPQQTDGRRQRSEESRRKIVAAMLALMRRGDVSPSAEAVAEQAKVGLRSVFRHFDNMESLYREINEAITAEVLPLWSKPLPHAEWRANFAEMLERRATIFEAVLPIRIAADVHRHASPFLDTEMKRMVRMQREGLLRVLPEALKAKPNLIEALDLTLSFEAWRRLRRDQKLAPRAARAVMEEASNALLASA